MVKSITGGYKVPYHPEGPDGPVWEIDFTPPFRRLDIISDLEKACGAKLPPADQFHTPGGAALAKGLFVSWCSAYIFSVINVPIDVSAHVR